MGEILSEKAGSTRRARSSVSRHLLKSVNRSLQLERPINQTHLMTDSTQPNTTPPDDDPLAHLHKMSTTAGLGTTEYVAVNGVSIVALILGVASALSLFDPVLLVIPAVAIVLAIAAFIQIKNSNGTQTGRGLAGLGFVIAIGFIAFVGGRAVLEVLGNREDQQAISATIATLDQDLRAGRYDEAYTLFGGRFTSKINKQKFTETWKHVVEGTKDYKGLTGMHSNGRMAFENNVDTGQKTSIGVTVLEFGNNSARAYFTLVKEPDGAWKFQDIKFENGADLFPPDQPAPRQK
jgi:hypothetical protein